MEHREIGLHTQASGFDNLIANEFVKGEIAGIHLFTNIPAVVIEDFDEQLKELIEEMRNGDNSN